MHFFYNIIYSILFLLNKYLGLAFTEYLLNKFENRMLFKYLSKSYVEASEIPTIQGCDLTDQLFCKLSQNYRNPVLIKGYNKDAKAVKKWNLYYLQNVIGDFPINVIRYDDKTTVKNMSFKQFANNVLNSNIYLNNNHTIFSQFPELFDDIKPQFTKFRNILTSTNLQNIHIANLFIGYDTNYKKKKHCSGSNLHCGGSGNFFCMISGRKHWTLIHPRHSCLLKGRVAPSGIHGQTLFEMNDHRDLSQYPEIYKYLPRYEVSLDPGDILWIPPWWWHRIRNDPGLSIGIAIRNNKVTALNLLNNATYTLAGYVYLLYNTCFISLYERLWIKQNKNFGASKEEKTTDNVLYQIDMLNKKYPHSLELEQCIQQQQSFLENWIMVDSGNQHTKHK